MLIATRAGTKIQQAAEFEFYGNWVNLGQRGSFQISGFAEASRTYFNKDLKDITLPEAALLAGIIQGPSYLSPYRHPERAHGAPQRMLDSMVETRDHHREAGGQGESNSAEAGAAERGSQRRRLNFVDLVRDTVSANYPARNETSSLPHLHHA